MTTVTKQRPQNLHAWTHQPEPVPYKLLGLLPASDVPGAFVATVLLDELLETDKCLFVLAADGTGCFPRQFPHYQNDLLLSHRDQEDQFEAYEAFEEYVAFRVRRVLRGAQ